MPSPRPATPAESRLQRLVDTLREDNARLQAQLEASLPVPHFVPIKVAQAFGYSTETVRRWCHRGLVNHRWDGSHLLVDQVDLTARCKRLTGQNT